MPRAGVPGHRKVPKSTCVPWDAYAARELERRSEVTHAQVGRSRPGAQPGVAPGTMQRLLEQRGRGRASSSPRLPDASTTAVRSRTAFSPHHCAVCAAPPRNCPYPRRWHRRRLQSVRHCHRITILGHHLSVLSLRPPPSRDVAPVGHRVWPRSMRWLRGHLASRPCRPHARLPHVRAGAAPLLTGPLPLSERVWFFAHFPRFSCL